MTPPRGKPQPPSNGERAGYVVTNVIKLTGVAIVVGEILVRSDVRPSVLALAAFMMAGAQGIESFARSFFGTKA